ncbi:MAG: GNAT family N-acetyltransferase, partial [Candidatus Woesebacteria bacterium]|nr:GNAT family N-acetyltransferase [Candidatus Woesebacteria bacterium]
EGIQKGIDNLIQKKSTLKKGKLWDKLLSDIASFQRLKDDVFNAHDDLTKSEGELTRVAGEKSASGKLIQEIKKKISSAKESLRSKLEILERRIENFRTTLPDVLSPALGKDRTEAITQEINMRVAEQFSHYDADRSTLSNLFAGQVEKQKEELESRPMSIFVWARNPDIDLYQGNYSPCCICIDSAHMGAESTISDYNTDLGVQIVNIWDETKNEPITAAWCWLGEDEDGTPALVVDNIESNTLYSAHYSELLAKELFKYLEEYAKKIGVKKVVLGKANNDLPTAGELSKMRENDRVFYKLGGANREDGYFLEAEEASVKIIWEKGAKVRKREGKEKKILKKPEVAKVEYLEIAVKGLSEEMLPVLRTLEKKIYEMEDEDLIRGQALVQDILEQKGIEHSMTIWGKVRQGGESEMIGYIAAMEGETDEGDASIYIDDIAVSPEAQRQGIGWKLLEKFIQKLKLKASTDKKPILLDIHLRPNSQAFMEKHKDKLNALGVNLIEEVLVPDYYDEGEDALYQVYEVSGVPV